MNEKIDDMVLREKNEIQPSASMMDAAVARQAQEVQAAMVVAKKFPRDINKAFDRILTACKRQTLAEQSLYAYPRGDKTVTGPSIRLAEAMAQNWGNIDFGITELEQKYGESIVQSYAWDLETNTRQTKTFTVKHERHTKKGSYKIEDPRDIYEMIANQGARRLRACILGVIPGDIVDAAVTECEKTLSGDNKEPLIDRVRKMTAAFAEMTITIEMIEARLKHKIEVTSEAELVGLRKIYQSIKDGMAAREDFFTVVVAAKPQEKKVESDQLTDEEKAAIEKSEAALTKSEQLENKLKKK